MYAMRPREHASRIAELPTLAERRAAIEAVPMAYQAMVKTHLSIIFRHRKMDRN